MIELIDVVSVQANDDYSLDCEMENGEIYHYDMSFIQEKKGEIFIPLKSINFFKQVFVEAGALEWPHGFGIHGSTIVKDGKLIKKSA